MESPRTVNGESPILRRPTYEFPSLFDFSRAQPLYGKSF